MICLRFSVWLSVFQRYFEIAETQKINSRPFLKSVRQLERHNTGLYRAPKIFPLFGNVRNEKFHSTPYIIMCRSDNLQFGFQKAFNRQNKHFNDSQLFLSLRQKKKSGVLNDNISIKTFECFDGLHDLLPKMARKSLPRVYRGLLLV